VSDWHDTKGSSRLGNYKADWNGNKWIAKRMQRMSFPMQIGRYESREDAKAACEDHMRGCLHLPGISTS
jgi:hypothetical protein